MAKIERKNLKVFAENAANNGVFGSAQNGTKITTQDPETVQSLDAWGAGWTNAVIGGSKLPPLEELQSTTFVPTYHLAYMFQEGIAEWNTDTTYHTNSFVKDGINLYYSLQDDNAANPLSESAWWAEWRFGEKWTVGDVKQSMLDPTAFALLNGNGWVPMDGSDVTGSVYETITGSSTVPNAAGAFIRSVGGAADSVGVLQADTTAQNGLTVQWASANVTTGTKTVSWASANASTSSTSHFHVQSSYPNSGGTQSIYGITDSTNGKRGAWNNSSTSNKGDRTNTTGGGLTVNKNQFNSNQTAHSHTFNKNTLNTGQSWAGDAETRPVNISLYYYIKVN